MKKSQSQSIENMLNELERMANDEMNTKNSLYSFILSCGMFDQLREYESQFSIRTAVIKARHEFEIEQSIKDRLIRFVNDNNLAEKYSRYQAADPDGHHKAINEINKSILGSTGNMPDIQPGVN